MLRVFHGKIHIRLSLINITNQNIRQAIKTDCHISAKTTRPNGDVLQDRQNIQSLNDVWLLRV